MSNGKRGDQSRPAENIPALNGQHEPKFQPGAEQGPPLDRPDQVLQSEKGKSGRYHTQDIGGVPEGDMGLETADPHRVAREGGPQ